MTDKKITQLDVATSASATDLLVMVTDNATTPVTQSITVSDFMTGLPTNIVTTGSTLTLSNDSGRIYMGAASDVCIYRTNATTISVSNTFRLAGSALVLYGNGATIYMGTAADVNLYRSNATLLATDNRFSASATFVGGDTAGIASTLGLTNTFNESLSTGSGVLKMAGATSRTQSGWLKIYNGTSARYIPYFTTITG
jgi:hypothetical protein